MRKRRNVLMHLCSAAAAAAEHAQHLQARRTDAPPVIDLARLETQPDAVARDVFDACSQWGFFQLVNHGVDDELRRQFDNQTRAFFALPDDAKHALRRSAANARGFYDDELTKQRLDWKQGYDFGVPASRDWATADGATANANLDGYNRFPPLELLPRFRAVATAYYDAMAELADRVSVLMARGLGLSADDPLVRSLRQTHSSYLRLNYYPPCDSDAQPPPLGISPHRDAGFLTILSQDAECHSLQMCRPGEGLTDELPPESAWISVVPERGALTVNTGDMAQIWSNGRYRAPLHRVLTHASRRRFSAPFFYNPGFAAKVWPAVTDGERPRYSECAWGYFRAQRFAGDFADYGAEIQVTDYEEGSNSWHLENQRRFLEQADFSMPFSVEGMRHLLAGGVGGGDGGECVTPAVG